jgi:hypothetical protein
VVDVVGDLSDECAERVVAQFGHVHDRVEAAQVVGLHIADVADQGGRRRQGADHLGEPFRAQPARLVVAGVEADDIDPVGAQVGRHQSAEVAVRAGDQDTHGLSF